MSDCGNTATGGFPLEIERIIAAPRAIVWRCWTEPSLLKQWYCPKPWGVAEAELDLRVGGRMAVVMAGPNGERVPSSGVYLVVEPLSKLVSTDAFDTAWVPSSKAFIVSHTTFTDAPNGHTHMRWAALHWSEADKRDHEAMGFQAGWTAAAAQLDELARSLR